MNTTTKIQRNPMPAGTAPIRFSWFNSQYDPTPAGTVTLDQLFRLITQPGTSTDEIQKAASIVAGIRSGQMDKAEKTKLPVFTPSAVITGNKGSFTPDRIREYSGFTQIDIDPKGNPELLTCQADAESLRDTLAGLPFVKIAALSASGMGVWLLVPVPDGKLKQYFKAYLNYFEDQLSITLDASKGTRPNQFRYFATDPGAILNDTCQPIALPPEPEPKPLPPPAPVRQIETELSPIADYNSRGDIVAELERHGWTVVCNLDDKTRLNSPKGEHKYNSEYDSKKQYFYNWSDRAEPFDPETGYTPASAWAKLNNIDPDNAALLNKELRAAGYGNKQSGAGYKKRIEAAGQLPPPPVETPPQGSKTSQIRHCITRQFTERLNPLVWLNDWKTDAELLYDLQVLADDCRSHYGIDITPDEYYQIVKDWEGEICKQQN